MPDFEGRLAKYRDELNALIAKGEGRSADEDKRLRELTGKVQELRAEMEAHAALAAADTASKPEGRMGDHTKKADPDDDMMADKKAEPRADKGTEPEKRDLNPTGKTGTPSGKDLPATGEYRMWNRTPEVREFLNIARRSRATSFLDAAVKESGRVKGADNELRQALGMDGSSLPWACMVDQGFLNDLAEGRDLAEIDPALAALDAPCDLRGDQPEARATSDTATTIATNMQGRAQAAIVQRVFARSSAAFIGVSIQPVPVGDHAWPVIEQSGGADPSFLAVGARKTAAAGNFRVVVLRPQDLSAAYLFHLQDLARVRGYENALRADLQMSMSDQLDKSIINGGADPEINGILTAVTTHQPAGSNLAAAAASFPTAIGKYAGAVDGLFAYGAKDLRMLMGPAVWARLESIVASNTAVTAAEKYDMRLGGVRVTSNMPAAAANVHKTIIAKGGARGPHAVAAVWNTGVSLIRDQQSEANVRQIRITAVAHYDMDVLRTEAYYIPQYTIS